MGYITWFDGDVEISPPLNKEEVAFLTKFAQMRHCQRKSGPYNVDVTDRHDDPDIIDYNREPEGIPGVYCPWAPTEDGEFLFAEEYNSHEAPEWMKYLIEHFIGSDPIAKKVDPEKFGFLQGHTLNGDIYAQGSESDDKWVLIVDDNVVKVADCEITYKRNEAKEV